jgi:hypothetical protein
LQISTDNKLLAEQKIIEIHGKTINFFNFCWVLPFDADPITSTQKRVATLGQPLP